MKKDANGNQIYKAGMSGGTVKLVIEKSCQGLEYTRMTWADGRIVFTPVKDVIDNADN